MSAARAQFALKFGTSPIVLNNGIAAGLTGGMPIGDLLGASNSNNADDAFATFVPVPGGSLLDWNAATYSFANQATAANAMVANGLNVSMRMLCPARDEGGYANKLSVMTGLQASLSKHNNLGGTYTVATPSFYYADCLLIMMRDVSSDITDSKQVQIAWQLDFYKPLLTIADAQAAQNTLMSKVTNATPVDGDPPAWSGLATTAGAPPSVGSTGASNTVAPPTGGPAS